MTKKSECPICKKKTLNPTDLYCKDHKRAKEALELAYENWLQAYDVLSWDNYLKKIIDLGGLAGKDVQAVAEYERFFKQSI